MDIDERSEKASHLRGKAKRARELALVASDRLTIERLESFAHECEIIASKAEEPESP